LKLLEIDDLTRPEHAFLGKDDVCYYLREYTPRAGYNHSETNDIIINFKKPIDRRGRPEWRYKESATARIAKEIRDALNPQWLKQATLVPMPPSASKNDPRHDDRMLQVLRAIDGGAGCDVRELLVQTQSTEPDHAVGDAGQRLAPGERAKLLVVDESLAVPPPSQIGIFDDVLTNGSHFIAAKTVLQHRFPNVPLVGVFFSRRKIDQLLF
jgi:hypothetical protein